MGSDGRGEKGQVKRIYLLLTLIPLLAACSGGVLGEKDFDRNWVVESESPGWEVEFRGDTCILTAPKGLTLWFRKELEADVAIEYDATVFPDRLSDLNCFWMATDPQVPDGNVFARMDERGGVFANCSQMKLYYVGYGGNWNSTTRFRRYDGNPGPAVLGEYTDEDHLLRRDHWYHIELTCTGGRVEYRIDGELLFDYHDPEPYTHGWFGFRTTLSRIGITNFKVSCPH